jgi:outer membrane protein assembly complex protein YaeT
VGSVTITGAKYFDLPTLQERLSVHARDAFDREGVYNQTLVANDVSALQAIYQNNGFSDVKVTPEIHDDDAQGTQAAPSKQVLLNVVYHIDEGQQLRVHSVQLEGAEKVDKAPLVAMLNTATGQPLSPESLGGDRDTLLTYYLSRGFDQAQVEVAQAKAQPDAGTAKVGETADTTNQVDVTFRIHEGDQVFLRRVLITGLHYTRLETIAPGITLHEGQPLDQTALLDTQRNLYDLALFNEVNPVIQNPTGEEPTKTVLLQTIEARRWDFSYGLGFEAQTGTVNGSTQTNPNGTTGASPRVLLELSRINLFGREQSASIRGTYGLLEQRINLLYQYPRFRGSRNFGISVSLGYNNSQDVTTYSASKLEGSLRLTEHFNGEHQLLSKANTFIYQFIFRRVKVDANSVQIEPAEIPLLSQAVQVGGPSFTWIRDTRDAPLDAHRGTYTSFQEFVSAGRFGSQADFNQVDVSNSSYYQLDKGKLVVARNTRYGQERAYGPAANELIPLPERLYGGGGSSHRGFGINSAGPRDPQTGFPIGGAGAFINSTELRLPPPKLPFVGNEVSFVVFHDMGNVFTNASDIWASALRFRQQNREGCRNLSTTVTGPVTSTGQQGTCTFNYFSHAPGVGVRYHTPVGPIRVDFSYNLNPPIYPVTYDSLNPALIPHVGEGSHFNFFFSLGQSF